MSEVIPDNERPGGSQSSLSVALILILLGGILLMRNLHLFRADFNWWALFIFVPAIAIFVNAWRGYQESGGQLTPQVRNQIVGGAFISLVGLTFLFDIDWHKLVPDLNLERYWPIILIVIGLAIMLRSSRR